MLIGRFFSSNGYKLVHIICIAASGLVILAMSRGAAAMSGSPPPVPVGQTVSNALGMTFVAIPPLEFTMGSPVFEPTRSDDESRHTVTLTRPFFIQATEVTQHQWTAVMGDNPSEFGACADCPVENVSWQDVQDFIDRLNRSENDGTYRLPTEAEWEAAARCGTRTPFSWGECLDTRDENFEGNYPMPGCGKQNWRKKTVPADSLSPNAWGLFGMHGNVSEWTQDWYGPYADENVVDPTGPTAGSKRVIRGGSWRNGASRSRSAVRKHAVPTAKNSTIGFRLVLDRDHP